VKEEQKESAFTNQTNKGFVEELPTLTQLIQEEKNENKNKENKSKTS